MILSLTRALSVALLSLTLTVFGCASETPSQRLDRLAARYIQYAMELDRLRPGEIDSWFGPQSLDTRGTPSDSSFTAVFEAATALGIELEDEPTDRGRRLRRRVTELSAVASYLATPTLLTFTEQVRELFAVDWIDIEPANVEAALGAIEDALPGRGSVRARVAILRQRLVIPGDKRQSVFETALAECRRRTLTHWNLPPDEVVNLVWTREVDAAWHRYEGRGQSTLEVNPLAIASADQALEVACHEGYPGHHAQFVLFDTTAGASGLALEDQLVLLRSPASALREGAAMAAVDLVFPPKERLGFEQEVLLPLAGISIDDAAKLAAIRPHLQRLALAVPSIIREHEERQLSDARAINRLQSEALVASPRALFAFAHEVGAYLAGYTLLDAAISARLGTKTEAAAWSQLRNWLERPERWFNTPTTGQATPGK